MGGGKSGQVVRGEGECDGAGGFTGVESEWGERGRGERGGDHWGGAGWRVAGVVGGSVRERSCRKVEREVSALVVGGVAQLTYSPASSGNWGAGARRNFTTEGWSRRGCGEENSAVGKAGYGVGGVGSVHEHGSQSRSVGMGGREMKTEEELKELVRQAVRETLRKKDAVLDQHKLGADLGAESIDRIDLTFRLEEALGKALEDKILFAQPDPTVAELAERLRVMLEGKK